jgi:FkbM family methyltransferase
MGILKRIRTKLNPLPPSESCEYVTLSYAQEGEDIMLKRMLNTVQNGFYVDIGAHHPFRFSNTYLFYTHGWRGINIDPIPGIKGRFDQYRPKDINLECAVNNKKEFLNYYNFQEKALNTFSEPLAKQYLDAKWKLEEVIPIMTVSLKEILDTHLPSSTKIDFMTIDVEGFEMNVLTSNDWTKYKPDILLIEILDCSIENIATNDIVIYLQTKGYVVFAKTLNTVFFKLMN